MPSIKKVKQTPLIMLMLLLAALLTALSEQRAESVKAALVAKGIDDRRLKSAGMGDAQPVAKNQNPDGSDNSEGRQKNRRVEVTVSGFEK